MTTRRERKRVRMGTGDRGPHSLWLGDFGRIRARRRLLLVSGATRAAWPKALLAGDCIGHGLCVNKQLDLQTLLTDFARAQAKAQGWYDNRREYQVEFIVALGFAALVGLSILLTHSVRGSVPMRGASGGLILLVFFVLVRASSFNKVDLLFSRRIAGLRANHLMELGGIALVTIFALAGAGVLGARRSS